MEETKNRKKTIPELSMNEINLIFLNKNCFNISKL